MGKITFLGSMLFVGLLLSVSAVDVDVITKYITTEVTTLQQDQPIVLIGSLCGLMKGNGVNVTVVLNNNPNWILIQGILSYFVVDAKNKTVKDALCTNISPKGVRGPSCIVKVWPSNGDLYIMGQAGPVAAISFSVEAEIIVKPKKQSTLKSSHSDELPDWLGVRPDWFDGGDLMVNTVYLTEVVTLSAASLLPRLTEAHVNFTLCPTPKTGSWYTLTSTVFGTDGRSTWAQYICDKYPCELSNPQNIVAHNGKQLPSNTVFTPSGQWTQMFAMIVCWGGPYDPAQKAYVGQFQFNAVMGGG